MIVADSSVWIDYFNGRPSRAAAELDRRLGIDAILIGDLILAEVLQGFRHERDVRRAHAALDQLFFAAMVGKAVALAAARNYRVLRSKGVTVRGTVDILIATFCIEAGHSLLYVDRDFDVIAQHLPLKII